MDFSTYEDVRGRLRRAGCVWAEDEAAILVDSVPRDQLDAAVRRRESGVPLEYVVGWAALLDVRVRVTPGVFVPRRRSELLVSEGTRAARARGPRPVVVDLCCGSGAVGVTLARTLSDVELHSADVDPDAVACARGNVEPIGGHVHEGDLYAALPPDLAGRVDVLVVNAPYVPTGELRLLPAEAREHEHRIALDGGPDGVDVHRRVAADAPRWLAPGGVLLIETSELQAPLTAGAMADAGLDVDIVTDDELDATVVTGVRRP